jgi:iron complex outermembrane receptor protein
MKKSITLSLLCCLAWMMSSAQDVFTQISGRVLNEFNNPVEGVNMLIKTANGSVFGKTTNAHGEFNLHIPTNRSGDPLYVRISHLGYHTILDTITTDPQNLVFYLFEKTFTLEGASVSSSISAGKDDPISSVTFTKKDIEKLNLGQDLPVLLNQTPSLVFTTDAGAGIGYTSLRIRGTDQSRINVTINGIPLNDPESQGVFWVNMPDFASSAQSIEIQRGVGSSTNGPGAFGANINIQTLEQHHHPSFQFNQSVGSFGTRRQNVIVHTGTLNQQFRLSGRLSKIVSDGYIDRASSDLNSYYISGSYQSIDQKFTADAIHFSGRETTYQAWYGTPISRVNNDTEAMLAFANRNLNREATEHLLNSGRTYNFYTYENETDNYRQDHYQLHLNYQFNPSLKASVSGFYVKGSGYFEQYRRNDKLSDYGLEKIILSDSSVIERTKLIRRRWLDNDYVGMVYAVHYLPNKKWKLQWGGNLNRYIGDHFGEVIWAEFAQRLPINTRYYFNQAVKDDLSSFIKGNVYISQKLSAYVDLQYRNVIYRAEGIDQNRRDLDIQTTFHFFNPKAGLNYAINKNARLYSSFSVANREPVRRDFVDALPGEDPMPERLYNLETGYRFQNKRLALDLNYYYMNYKNQLVLTGEINDVGGYVRRNVGESYRSGIELQTFWKTSEKLQIGGNITLSKNIIMEYRELVSDWIQWNLPPAEFVYESTPIAFSPQVISALFADLKVIKNLTAHAIFKWVGPQFLDNSGNSEAALLPAYHTLDTRLGYTLTRKKIQIECQLLVNNIYNSLFSSNGYTYKYFFGGPDLHIEKMVYPQAGRNGLLGLQITF